MEKNIQRQEDIPQSNIKHLIGFKTKLVTKENAGDGSGGKFIPMWSRVHGETKTTKTTKGRQVRGLMMKKEIRCLPPQEWRKKSVD